MGQKYTELSDKLCEFIAEQKIYFVGTAADTGRINISPKGMDSLRVLGKNRVAWLNVTGSGNETAAHVQINPRMTLMFCAFNGSPLILRLYGEAKAVHRNESEWASLFALFDPIPGARQIFDMSVELVQTSCGMAVPNFDYVGDRDLLTNWAQKRGDQGLKEYWEQKNQLSIDGFPTHILNKNF
ncbi:MAG TPA: pyridoxamine 5'-phosphate oxidase family protein [Limnobacter sp.]|uniref:pyridoxamine 5'-phosphate oxidase family protein n=1 Tax=Limnobacter sp. TaxID=2003368 RepID=UPI002ED98084